MNNIADQLKGVASKSRSNTNNTNNNNNKTVAGLLAIFLGSLGVHRFYLGYKEIGFIQLGIFAVSLFLFAPIIWICWIWAIADAVSIFNGKLKNSNGTELV